MSEGPPALSEARPQPPSQAAVAAPAPAAEQTLNVRLVSLNVRYAITRPVAKEKPWPVRRPRLCNQLNFVTAGHASAFLCLQEVLASQLDDIQASLGSDWAHVGRGRDDGKRKGEFSPIFYRHSTWSCDEFHTVWLSETPDRPSKGWDAAQPRIATVGVFSHRHAGTRMVVISTHFDHRGVVARERSARLLLRIINGWAAKKNPDGSQPAILLGGDFNSSPEDKAYRTMVSPGSGVVDLSTRVPEESRYGNAMTYTSFGEPGERPMRIDFLFASQRVPVTVLTFGVLCNQFDDDVLLSDHRAVVADLDIPIRPGSGSSGGGDDGTKSY